MSVCPRCRSPLSKVDVQSRRCGVCLGTWQSDLPDDASAEIEAGRETSASRSVKIPSVAGTLDPDSWTPANPQNEKVSQDEAASAQDSSKADTKQGAGAISTIELQDSSERNAPGEDALKTYWKGLSKGSNNPTVTLGSGSWETSLPIATGLPVDESELATKTPLRSLKSTDRSEAKDADYEILSFVDEGSMGKVFLARQNSIQRNVAIKLLKEDLAKEDKHRTKFLAEAVVTGELDHPNIVPVHDLGISQDNELFYSMKMIHGDSWQALIGKKSRGENVEILLHVADAVAYGHSKNIIHRDLKPENVMLGSFGEILVADWGIAVQLEKDRNVALAGTPAYMAPEMAHGPPNAVGKHSDIYLLGAILFQIIVGKAPHHLSEDTWEVLSHAAANNLVETDRQDELLTIAYQAMATRTQDRYATVEQFQEAVRTYQTHAESLVILQRAESDLKTAQTTESPEVFSKALFGFQDAIELWPENRLAYQGLREAKQAYAKHSLKTENFELGISLLDVEDERDHRLLKRLELGKKGRDQRVRRLKWTRIAAFALVSALLVILTGFSFILNGKNSDLAWQKMEAVDARNVADEKRQEAEEEKKKADKQRQIAEEEKKKADKQRHIAEGEKKKADKQRQIAEEEKKKADDQRGVAESLLQPALRGQFLSKIALAKSRIDANDSSRAVDELDSLREDPQLKEFADWEWDRLYYLCHPDAASTTLSIRSQAIAANVESRQVASASRVTEGAQVQLWEVVGNENLVPGPTTIAKGLSAKCLAFSPDGRFLAIGGRAAQKREDQPVAIIYRIDESSLTQEFVVTAANYFSATSMKMGHIESLAFHPTKPWLVTAGAGPKALIFRRESSRNWKLAAKNLSHRGYRLREVAIAPDGSAIAVINQSGDHPEKQGVYIWPLNENGIDFEQRYKNMRPGNFHAVAFSPKNPTMLAIAAADGRVSLWDWRQKNTAPRELRWHQHSVRDLCFSPKGDKLLSASEDRLIQVWERQRDHDSSSTSGWVRSKRVPALKGHGSPVISALFISSTRLVSLDDSWNSRTWNIDHYFDELKWPHDGKERLPCSQASFGPQGRVIVTAGRDGYVRLWNGLQSEAPGSFIGAEGIYAGHPRIKGNSNLLAGAIQLPNSKQLAIATFHCLIPTARGTQQDGSLCFWNAESGHFLLKVATPRAKSMSTTADGHFLAIGRHANPEKIEVWNLQAEPGLRCKRISSEGFALTATAFQPGTGHLFVGLRNGQGNFLAPPYTSAQEVSLEISKNLLRSQFSAHGKWLFLTGEGKSSNYLWTANPNQGTVLPEKIEFAGSPFHLDTASHSETHRAVVVSGKREMGDDVEANRLTIVEIQAGQPVKRHELRGPFICATISPDGKMVLALKQLAGGPELVQWLPDSNQQSPHPLSGQLSNTSPHNLTFLSEDRLLSYGKQRVSKRIVAQVWDLAAKQELSRMVSGSPVLAARLSADGQKVFSACQSGVAFVWDVTAPRRPEIVRQLMAPNLTYVTQAAITHDTSQVAMIGGSLARVMDLANSKIEPITSEEARPKAVASSAQGVTIAFDNGRIWVRRADDEAGWLEAESIGAVQCLCLATDSSALAAQIGDMLFLWFWQDGHWTEPMKIKTKNLGISAMVFSASKKRILTGDKDGIISVLQIDHNNKDVNPLFSWRAHTSEIRSLEFSTDGQHLSSSSAKGEAAIWPTQAKQQIQGSTL